MHFAFVRARKKRLAQLERERARTEETRAALAEAETPEEASEALAVLQGRWHEEDAQTSGGLP